MGKVYDFSRFAESPRETQRQKPIDNTTDITVAKNKEKILKKENNKRSITMFFVALVFLAFFALLLNSKANLTGLSDKIITEQQSLAELEAENTRLNMELEAKMSTRNVEEYAKNVLGMQKVDPSQIERILGATEDKAEISGDRTNSILDLFK